MRNPHVYSSTALEKQYAWNNEVGSQKSRQLVSEEEGSGMDTGSFTGWGAWTFGERCQHTILENTWKSIEIKKVLFPVRAYVEGGNIHIKIVQSFQN